MTIVGTVAQRRGMVDRRAAAPIDETFIPSGLLPKSARITRELPRASRERARRELNARLQVRYRLLDADGRLLHFSGAGRTADADAAWIGFDDQLRAMFARDHPDLKALRVVAVFPESRGAFNSTASR